MKKDILALFVIVLLVAVVINGTNIQSVDEYYLTHIDAGQRDGYHQHPV